MKFNMYRVITAYVVLLMSGLGLGYVAAALDLPVYAVVLVGVVAGGIFGVTARTGWFYKE